MDRLGGDAVPAEGMVACRASDRATVPYLQNSVHLDNREEKVKDTTLSAKRKRSVEGVPHLEMRAKNAAYITRMVPFNSQASEATTLTMCRTKSATPSRVSLVADPMALGISTLLSRR